MRPVCWKQEHKDRPARITSWTDRYNKRKSVKVLYISSHYVYGGSTISYQKQYRVQKLNAKTKKIKLLLLVITQYVSVCYLLKGCNYANCIIKIFRKMRLQEIFNTSEWTWNVIKFFRCPPTISLQLFHNLLSLFYVQRDGSAWEAFWNDTTAGLRQSFVFPIAFNFLYDVISIF